MAQLKIAWFRNSMLFTIIESVDSMLSRDGPDIHIICNTLQMTQNLRIDKFCYNVSRADYVILFCQSSNGSFWSDKKDAKWKKIPWVTYGKDLRHQTHEWLMGLIYITDPMSHSWEEFMSLLNNVNSPRIAFKYGND